MGYYVVVMHYETKEPLWLYGPYDSKDLALDICASIVVETKDYDARLISNLFC